MQGTPPLLKTATMVEDSSRVDVYLQTIGLSPSVAVYISPKSRDIEKILEGVEKRNLLSRIFEGVVASELKARFHDLLPANLKHSPTEYQAEIFIYEFSRMRDEQVCKIVEDLYKVLTS